VSAAAEWLRYAHGDLDAARVLLGADVPPRTAAWHAQQAAEKAMKAVLVALGHDVPRTHDLLDLARRVAPTVPGLPSTESLAELSVHAVQPRYPDDLPDVDEAEALRAVETAETVVTSVETALHHGGRR
jgi:HEPN domain-containing protein